MDWYTPDNYPHIDYKYPHWDNNSVYNLCKYFSWDRSYNLNDNCNINLYWVEFYWKTVMNKLDKSMMKCKFYKMLDIHCKCHCSGRSLNRNSNINLSRWFIDTRVFWDIGNLWGNCPGPPRIANRQTPCRQFESSTRDTLEHWGQLIKGISHKTGNLEWKCILSCKMNKYLRQCTNSYLYRAHNVVHWRSANASTIGTNLQQAKLRVSKMFLIVSFSQLYIYMLEKM